jgi:hypothetical protein
MSQDWNRTDEAYQPVNVVRLRHCIQNGVRVTTISDSTHIEALASHPMSTASPEIQDLARRLLAFEATNEGSSDARALVAVRVIEDLREHLIKLTGVHGFRSLLSRALTLSKAEVPSLYMVEVSADGSLKGFGEIERTQGTFEALETEVVLVAHILELLVTFIGKALTLRLLRDKWPDASMDEAALRTEENHERS